MSTPAVGPIIALTYASAIDDPGRFESSKQVGAHFGLTPKKHQSGETDYKIVIASEAKQSIVPRKENDCFVALLLAMTSGWGGGVPPQDTSFKEFDLPRPGVLRAVGLSSETR